MNEYDFNQMLAEAKVKLGMDRVLPVVEAAARIFGWPIPKQYREDVILPLALMLREIEPTWSKKIH
jgi:hypothetical protein